MNTPAEMAQNYVVIGKKKTELPVAKALLLGIMAGLFIAIGLIPQNEAFANVITLDERGYASADESCVTGANGIFVAGDCRTKKIRQVATAAADGAVAALAVCDYVDSLK